MITIKLYRYTILDISNGKVFKTVWTSDHILEGGGEKFIAPVTFSDEHHVSIYINKPEACRIVKVEERDEHLDIQIVASEKSKEIEDAEIIQPLDNATLNAPNEIINE